MSPAACKRRLAAIGLSVAFEKSAVIGHEFDVTDATGETVACGYHEGSKSDAADELMRHPVIALRLQRAGAS